MSYVWVLLVLLSMPYKGAATTVGPFISLAECKSAEIQIQNETAGRIEDDPTYVCVEVLSR